MPPVISATPMSGINPAPPASMVLGRSATTAKCQYWYPPAGSLPPGQPGSGAGLTLWENLSRCTYCFYSTQSSGPGVGQGFYFPGDVVIGWQSFRPNQIAAVVQSFPSGWSQCQAVGATPVPTPPSQPPQAVPSGGQPCPPPVIQVNCGTTCPPGQQPQTLPGTSPPAVPPSYIEPSYQSALQPADVGVCSLSTDGTYPPVGSAEWCACLDELKLRVASIGQSVHDLLLMPNAGSESAGPGLIKGFLSSLLSVESATTFIERAVPGLVDSVWEQISTLWGSIQSVVGSFVPANPQMFIGIVLTKTLLRGLRRLRLGTDALAWATLDIDVAFGPLETLLDYLINDQIKTQIPDVPACIESYLQQTAPVDQVRCWLGLHGVSLDVWMPVIEARRQKLSPQELIEWSRRNGVGQEDQIAALLKQGWTRDGEAYARVKLYDRLPSISDFVHWLQRNVYDEQYVQQYGLMEGFEERFWSKFGADISAQGRKKEYAALDYAAHWINPAPTQMQEMLYRLAPDLPGVQNPFTLADYERILAEQDVAPYFRKRFAEIAYRVPALGYLRDMYRQGIIDDTELKLYHRKLGYTEVDSRRFVEIDSVMKTRTRAEQSHGWTPYSIAHAYAAGSMQSADVYRRMNELAYTPQEADRLMDRAEADLQYTIVARARGRVIFSLLGQLKGALAAGVLTTQDVANQLISMGWPEQFAVSWANLQNTAAQTGLIKQATGRIRSAFLSGEIDVSYVRASLQQLAIVPTAAESFITIWQLENTPRRKRRTASQIVNDVADGMLSTIQAELRLHNLGYDDADTLLYMADARRKILQRETKALAAADRNEQRRIRELEIAAKDAEKQHRQLIADLRRLAPPAKLARWAALDVIDHETYVARMRAQEQDEVTIEAYYHEACQREDAVCDETQKNGQTH